MGRKNDEGLGLVSPCEGSTVAVTDGDGVVVVVSVTTSFTENIYTLFINVSPK